MIDHKPELPGMPPKQEPDLIQTRSGKTVWFYVTNKTNSQTRCFISDAPGTEWKPVSLHDPKIALFNTRCAARREAVTWNGKVKIYPYDPATQRPW